MISGVLHRETMIKPFLPFAAPLRAVDHVVVDRRDGAMTIHASKLVDADDPYMRGHFPDFTIYPGVFIIESVRQAVATALGPRDGLMPDIVTINSVRFLAPALEGQLLTLEAVVDAPVADGTFRVAAQCKRGDGVTAARLDLEFRYGGPQGV